MMTMEGEQFLSISVIVIFKIVAKDLALFPPDLVGSDVEELNQ